MAQYGVLEQASKNIWGFDPRTIPGCTLWMDAADSNTITVSSGTTITQWRDKSNSAAVFNIVSASPNTSTANGYTSVLIANAANGTTVTTDQSLLSAGSVAYCTAPGQFAGFIVATYTATSVNNVIQDNASSSNFNVGTSDPYIVTINGSATTSGQSYGAGSSSRVMLGFTYDPTLASGSRVATYYSGTAGNVGGTGTATSFTNRLRLNTPLATINGSQTLHFHEILLYSASLPTSERQQIEGYLAWKWGLQGTGTAPVISLPITHPYRDAYSIVRPFLRNFTPTDVPNPCLLWFDGRDSTTLSFSGSNVTAWRDKSGNANDITSFSTTQPTYSESTGFLTFTNGTGTTTNSIALTSTTSYSIFYVVSFFQGLTDTGGPLVYARPFQLTGTPLFFFAINRQAYTVTVSGASISGSNTTYNVTNTTGLTTGNTVTIAGITLGSATGYNGTGVVQSFVPNTSITINITSTGTPTSFSGATARNGTSNVPYYIEGNGGGGPFYFFSTQGFNTYSGSIFVTSMTQTGATTYTLGLNGIVSAQTAATARMANRQVVIGTGIGNPYGLGEVLLYDGALSTQDRRRVEGYLSWKWGGQRTAYPGANTNFPTTHPFYRFPTPTVTPFNPISQTNLLMWYDGADASSLTLSGSTITAWNDKSGNGNHLTVAVGPTRTATSSNPTGWDVSFNGSTQYIRSNSLAVTNGTNTMTVFIVVKNTASSITGRIIAGITSGPETTENGAFRFANAATNSIAITKGSLTGTQDGTNYTISSDVYHIITITWNGAANSPVFVDGSLNGTYSANSNTTFSFTRFGLGASLGTSPVFTPATFWTGSLNEVIIYRSALSSTQRQQMEGHLAWKWGLNSSLPTTHPYYKVRP